jgi:hypothetical protein
MCLCVLRMIGWLICVFVCIYVYVFTGRDRLCFQQKRDMHSMWWCWIWLPQSRFEKEKKKEKQKLLLLLIFFPSSFFFFIFFFLHLFFPSSFFSFIFFFLHLFTLPGGSGEAMTLYVVVNNCGCLRNVHFYRNSFPLCHTIINIPTEGVYLGVHHFFIIFYFFILFYILYYFIIIFFIFFFLRSLLVGI